MFGLRYGNVQPLQVGTPIEDFGTLFKKCEAIYGYDQAGHNIMADKDINFMKTELIKYFHSYSNYNSIINNLNNSGNAGWSDENQFVDMLAWSGLQETNSWKETKGKDSLYMKQFNYFNLFKTISKKYLPKTKCIIK